MLTACGGLRKIPDGGSISSRALRAWISPYLTQGERNVQGVGKSEDTLRGIFTYAPSLLEYPMCVHIYQSRTTTEENWTSDSRRTKNREEEEDLGSLQIKQIAEACKRSSIYLIPTLLSYGGLELLQARSEGR